MTETCMKVVRDAQETLSLHTLTAPTSCLIPLPTKYCVQLVDTRLYPNSIALKSDVS